MPSIVGRTSRRASAASPGSSDPIARGGAEHLEGDVARRSLDEPEVRLALTMGDEHDAHLTSDCMGAEAH